MTSELGLARYDSSSITLGDLLTGRELAFAPSVQCRHNRIKQIVRRIAHTDRCAKRILQIRYFSEPRVYLRPHFLRAHADDEFLLTKWLSRQLERVFLRRTDRFCRQTRSCRMVREPLDHAESSGNDCAIQLSLIPELVQMLRPPFGACRPLELRIQRVERILLRLVTKNSDHRSSKARIAGKS
jgi:hypothetical protein